MNYVLTLTPPQLEVISRALGQMPYAMVNELVDSMQKQINEQNEKMAAEAEAAKNPPAPPTPPPAS